MNKLADLEERISSLPEGYVTRKVINNKPYYYHQWKSNGKNLSRTLSEEEVEPLKAQIEERKKLEKELKIVRKMTPDISEFEDQFNCNVTVGDALKDLIQTASQYKTRDCIERLDKYINGPTVDKVCVVYGLRRTGKTTMLKQEMLSFSEVQLKHTVYIKARTTDTISSINKDIKKLEKAGYKYLFIDEATLMEDFIDGAALFSDVYAATGMKIVLSGTDSLGFYFAEGQELYDRAITIHTTVIPYREHSRLLGITDIDEYIRYGGTLKAGELDFENAELNTEEASFRDDESARRYIDTAICKNIQHSLRCYENGRYFRHLRELYEKNELTNAINRIIEDENHEFTVDVITSIFKSHDLHSTAQMLRSARDEEKRTDVLDDIDTTVIMDTLKKILDIKEKEEQEIGVTEVHVNEIKQYLKHLDLTEILEIDFIQGSREEYTIFTQPGMRFCQAQALVYSLMKDDQIKNLDAKTIQLITDKIIEGVLGHMLEDIVIFETKRELAKNSRSEKKSVYKIRFENHEYDMLVYDANTNTCEAYEIKHTTEPFPNQYRHLINEDFVQATEKRFGQITKRCVLYRGKTYTEENGIEYKNVEEYLCELGM